MITRSGHGVDGRGRKLPAVGATFFSYFPGLGPKTKFPREMQTLDLGSTSGFLVLSPRNGPLVTTFCSPSPGRGSPSSPPTSLGLPEAQISWAPEANGAESRLLLQGQRGKQPSPDLGILGRRQNAQGGIGPWDRGRTGSSGDVTGAARTGSTWLGEKRTGEVTRQFKALGGSRGRGHVQVTAPSGLSHGLGDPQSLSDLPTTSLSLSWGHSLLLSLLCALRIPSSSPGSHLTGDPSRPAHRGPYSTSWPLGTGCLSDSGLGGSTWRTGSECGGRSQA